MRPSSPFAQALPRAPSAYAPAPSRTSGAPAARACAALALVLGCALAATCPVAAASWRVAQAGPDAPPSGTGAPVAGTPDGDAPAAVDGTAGGSAPGSDVAPAPGTASDAGPAAGGALPAPDASVPFDREWLVAEAERLSREPDPDARMKFEGDYADLGYDGYRDLRFRADARPWAGQGLSFELDLLPPGFLYDRPVSIHLVEDGRAVELPYDPALLDTGPLASVPTNPDELAWSGFRVRHPLNRPDVMDEVVVFQGASYFRAVARDQLYGLSARGLAIDTAEPDGEEFPRFVAFWIEKPSPDAASITVHALLQSESVTGAYSFAITPGEETRMEVRSTLFPRVDLAHVGIAPLTSMFLFDATNRDDFDDWRDEVHDSDGLQMVNGVGERLLRSLGNGRTLQVSSFVDRDPKAFGLVQRHRAFADYQDAEARYDLRPSAWVEPVGAWGEGRVELVEIPSREEIHDNVVAYWRPSATLEAGSRHDYDYRLSWTATPADAVPLWRLNAARTGRSLTDPDLRRVVLDFAPPAGVAVPTATPGNVGDAAIAGGGVGIDALRPNVSAGEGEVRNVVASRLPGGERYRLSFEYDPKKAEAADLRVRLSTEDGTPASETWLWRWTK